MTVEDYIKLSHKMPLVLYDVMDDEEEKVCVKQTIFCKKVKPIDLEDWIANMEACSYDFDAEPKPNTAVHGPQGHKNEYDGNKFDSLWEAAFYIWKKEVKGEWVERNRFEHLDYYIDGKKRKFYPDFKCVDGYYEVKGIWRPNDMEKQAQHPEVHFLDGTDMKPIIDELKKVKPNWKKDITLL